MIKVNRHNHFIWLTVALVGMLIAGALTSEFPERFTFSILQYSNIALLLLALVDIREDRPWRTGLLILIGIMALASIARDVTEYPYLEYVYLFLRLAFFVSAAWLVGRRVLLTGHVDINIITGSVALYLIIGLIWATIYTLLVQLSPEAITGLEAGDWSDILSAMTYFSFVTLTTLGYGDISPVSPIARVLVILEAVTGMFYFAIVVASLVGSARSGKSTR